MDGLIRNADTINKLLARYGVKFGIYKNGEFKEQLFPFDPIPRIIDNKEFSYLEKGLIQRVNALNCSLCCGNDARRGSVTRLGRGALQRLLVRF